MILRYTTKDAPAIITFDVNANKNWSQGNRKYTNMNSDNTVEEGNETEILCTGVNFLLKVPASNNTRNEMQKILQGFLVQI